MNRLVHAGVTMVIIAGVLAPRAAVAQPATAPGTSGRSAAVWIIAGAAGGFGLGLSLGLRAFDDSVNSDRKVWTSAIVGAGLGALGGYLVAKARHHAPASGPNHLLSRGAAHFWDRRDSKPQEPSQPDDRGTWPRGIL